jgi:hypothetical protein
MEEAEDALEVCKKAKALANSSTKEREKREKTYTRSPENRKQISIMRAISASCTNLQSLAIHSPHSVSKLFLMLFPYSLESHTHRRRV